MARILLDQCHQDQFSEIRSFAFGSGFRLKAPARLPPRSRLQPASIWNLWQFRRFWQFRFPMARSFHVLGLLPLAPGIVTVRKAYAVGYGRMVGVPEDNR